MTLLSSDVGNHAPGHSILLGEDRFEFRHFGMPELAQFERERYRIEREKLRELRDDYPPDVYVERLDQLRERYERHEFRFENDDAFRTSPEGVLLILRVMTGRNDRDCWRLFCETPEEVAAVMEQVIRESFPKARAARNGATEAAKS
jgi:hypothetical protein